MKKLFRKRNSKFAGICSGLADYLGIDESVVKVILKETEAMKAINIKIINLAFYSPKKNKIEFKKRIKS